MAYRIGEGVARDCTKEVGLQVVGIERSDTDTLDVHTIDVWYSTRRGSWIVERLDSRGDQVGSSFLCESEDDAVACLDEWLRAHDQTHLVSPRDTTAAERRILAKRSRRAA